MIVNLEITFIANFIINTTILFISAYLVNYKKKFRIIVFSFVYTISSMALLYIGNYFIYLALKIMLILVFPIILVLKSNISNVFTLVASFLLICGISVLVNQYLRYELFTSILISFLLIIFIGVVPRFISRAKENEGLVILIINSKKIRAFVDTGILLPSTTIDEINILLNEDVAMETLTDQQFYKLINKSNIVEFETASAEKSSMSWIDINDIEVRKNRKTIKVNSKVYLSKVKLPYDALISSLNI